MGMLGIISSQITAVPTSNPNISNTSVTANGLGYDYKWRCKNNDATNAIIYSDASVSPPTTSRGTIAYLAYTAYITVTTLEFGITVYAQAKAVDKDASAVISVYLEPR